MVQGTLQGALLSPAKHGRVNGDLHSLLTAEPHSLLLTDHFALVLICKRAKTNRNKENDSTEMFWGLFFFCTVEIFFFFLKKENRSRQKASFITTG